MTQEDKELLMKDLCARLPYGVMLSITHNEYTDETFNARLSDIDYCGEIKVRYGFEEYEQVFSLEQIKPYLFPLSSMTEEQSIYMEKNKLIIASSETEVIMNPYGYDFLNKNHFDYRGLIEKGLAIDATGLNIY